MGGREEGGEREGKETRWGEGEVEEEWVGKGKKRITSDSLTNSRGCRRGSVQSALNQGTAPPPE